MLKKLLAGIVLLLCITSVFAQTYPERPTQRLVNDLTGETLSQEQIAQLDAKLKRFEDSTSNQIAVVIIRSLEGREIIDYGVGLMRKWGIGTKEKSNGVMVLVSTQDRKMSIQVGYGLEGALPDITTQQIIQNDMVPKFKTGDYFGGLDQATNDIIKATKGEYKAAPKPKRSNGNGGIGSSFIVIIIVIIVLIIVFKNRGGGGGGRRVIGSRGGSDAFWWLMAANALGSGGRSSGGGGWGGGSSDSGSSWGGFGGGSTGGGGSSGSW